MQVFGTFLYAGGQMPCTLFSKRKDQFFAYETSGSKYKLVLPNKDIHVASDLG